MGYFRSINRKKRNKRRFLMFFFIIILLIIFVLLFNKKVKINKDYIAKIALGYFFVDTKKIEIEPNVIKSEKEELSINEPIVYIYNTHDGEKYAYNKVNEYNLDYDVTFASHILKANLDDLGINAFVETSSVSNQLRKNNYSYAKSYEVSRVFLEQMIISYPSLKYFIDLHRDSAPYEVTTCTINEKKYAKLLFVIGLENQTFASNKKLAVLINDKIKEYNECLSRGILEKKGEGVNGIYNQDFNENVILIEVGGLYNTIEEVANTIEILAKSFYQVIKEAK